MEFALYSAYELYCCDYVAPEEWMNLPKGDRCLWFLVVSYNFSSFNYSYWHSEFSK